MLLETQTMNHAVQPAKQIDAAMRRKIQWASTGNPQAPYTAPVDGTEWRIQVNDFPAEALYTLLIDNHPIGDLDDWPSAWHRPN